LHFLSSSYVVTAVLPLAQWSSRVTVIAVLAVLLHTVYFQDSRENSSRSINERVISNKARNIISGLAIAWSVSTLFFLILKLATIFEGSINDVLTDLGILRTFIVEVRTGQAIFVQVLAGFIIAIWAQLAKSHIGLRVLTLFTVISILPPALTGHSGSSSLHQLAVTSWGLHIAAVSLWSAGIASLIYSGFYEPEKIVVRGKKFSNFALICFVATIMSGVANSYVRISFFGNLLASTYGKLLVGKLIILLILMAMGAFYRKRIFAMSTPIHIFHRLLSLELFMMALAIMLGVLLSSTSFPRPV
jgi:putative copper export protein